MQKRAGRAAQVMYREVIKPQAFALRCFYGRIN